MSSVNCMIVDDEPLSQDVLKKYIADTPGLNLVASPFNALEAMEILRDHPVDLIFLDINLPKLTGISLVKSMENPPLVIFTTAYPQYAVEGFDLDAVDYLLKPISFERFLKGVNKAVDILKRQKAGPGAVTNEYMSIRADKKIYNVPYADILYFQSYGDFVKVFLTGKMLITAGTLKNLERVLPDQFIRVHKSYIISLRHVRYIEGNTAWFEKQNVPVSPNLRDALLGRMNPQAGKNGK